MYSIVNEYKASHVRKRGSEGKSHAATPVWIISHEWYLSTFQKRCGEIMAKRFKSLECPYCQKFDTYVVDVTIVHRRKAFHRFRKMLRLEIMCYYCGKKSSYSIPTELSHIDR